jgi:peptidoglycan/LPS O-acetylase OafA/YrhL
VLFLQQHNVTLSSRFMLGCDAGHAVMYFYVISGFLITFTLHKNYSDDFAGIRSFYRSRFIRIFSLYWPIALISFWLFPDGLTHLLQAAPADQLTGILILGMDWRISFAEGGNHWAAALDGLHQTWTLALELTFYLLAPLLVRSKAALVVAFVASAALRGGFAWHFNGALVEPWTYIFFPTSLCFFALGAISYHIGQLWPATARPVAALAFLAVAIAAMTRIPGAFDHPAFWLSIWCFSAALPGIFAMTHKNAVMNFAGNLSYPLYLIHILPFMFVPTEYWNRLASLIGANPKLAAVPPTLVFLALLVVAAVAVHVVVERPTAFLMRIAFMARRGRHFSEPELAK